MSAFRFGSKAETLAALRPLVDFADVPELRYFSVQQWTGQRAELTRQVVSFAAGRRLAVRSSAMGEDGHESSMAGAYHTVLGVEPEPGDVERAVDEVIASFSGDPRDQVLIQPLLEGIAVSGVITTSVVDDGAPYYVFNYDDDSGKTDVVTGGSGVSKTVLVFRNLDLALVESPRLRRWLELTRGLERLCGEASLDIEFAETHDGRLFLFQVRRIAASRTWNRATIQKVERLQDSVEAFVTRRSLPRPGIWGARTILGEMPDWNPAEIIGTSPRPLSASLYRILITDRIWHEARTMMGYRRLPADETLMILLGGRPFIDVRNSLNSLLPSGLGQEDGSRLVDAWLARLDEHVELHDKVEFQVAYTCLDFAFDEFFATRYPDLDRPLLERFRASIGALTNRALTLGTRPGGLDWACAQPDALAARLAESLSCSEPLVRVSRLVGDCQELGTRPFAVAARHAFIAESLLRSALQRGALDAGRLAAFKASLTTVAGRMARDFARVARDQLSRGEFLRLYGHLRPGTYDILSLRYDEREDLFDHCLDLPDHPHAAFAWSAEELSALGRLLDESGLEIDPAGLVDYCGRAIVAREEVKFQFTHHLSEILRQIALWGEAHGLERETLSYLSLEGLLGSLHDPPLIEPATHFGELARLGRERVEVARAFRANYLIRDRRDLHVAPLHRAAANFVTDKRVEGRVVVLDARSGSAPELYGAIVCIEQADPGFDWIFTRGPAGLVTRYGGSNSHMAVRAAELGLPAAIGCGEVTFTRACRARAVELNCAERLVRPLDSA